MFTFTRNELRCFGILYHFLVANSCLSLCLLASLSLAALPQAQSAEGPELLFFTVFGSGRLVDRVRSMLRLPTGREGAALGPQLALLDIPDDGGYYLYKHTDADTKAEAAGPLEVTTELVKAFIDAYKAGSLTRYRITEEYYDSRRAQNFFLANLLPGEIFRNNITASTDDHCFSL
jgi:hypothetical protein